MSDTPFFSPKMWRVEVTDKQVYYSVDDEYGLLNSYFMPVCSIVKTAVDENSASGLHGT